MQPVAVYTGNSWIFSSQVIWVNINNLSLVLEIKAIIGDSGNISKLMLPAITT